MSLIDDLRQRKTYLTTQEVMAILGGTSRNTICAWARAGQLPAIRCGAGYLYDPQVTADWLEARATAPAKRAA